MHFHSTGNANHRFYLKEYKFSEIPGFQIEEFIFVLPKAAGWTKLIL